MKRAASLLLAVFMAAPPIDVVSAPELGTIKGAVTVSSRPIRGVSLAFVDLASGNIYRATSEETGSFQARVPAGRYVLTTENGAGLAVGRAPSMIAVSAGQVATADVDLAPIPGATMVSASGQESQAPAGGQLPSLPGTPATSTEIHHDPIGCFVAGQFPLIDAGIEPAGSVARARVYFKAAGSENWYYVEMTPAEAGFIGKLPRPKLEASPITYYVQATTTEFGENRTPENDAIVVLEAKDCPGDKKVAGIGPPGEVTVFSAATGAAIAPIGFAAGGLALTAGTLALILGGAAAVGLTTAVVVNDTTTTTSTTTTTTTTTPAPPTTTTTTTTLPPPAPKPTVCPGCPPLPAICTIIC
jgi:hypothetical protein